MQGHASGFATCTSIQVIDPHPMHAAGAPRPPPGRCAPPAQGAWMLRVRGMCAPPHRFGEPLQGPCRAVSLSSFPGRGGMARTPILNW